MQNWGNHISFAICNFSRSAVGRGYHCLSAAVAHREHRVAEKKLCGVKILNRFLEYPSLNWFDFLCVSFWAGRVYRKEELPMSHVTRCLPLGCGASGTTSRLEDLRNSRSVETSVFTKQNPGLLPKSDKIFNTAASRLAQRPVQMQAELRCKGFP